MILFNYKGRGGNADVAAQLWDASVTFEEMEEVDQKSKNTKADGDTLEMGCSEAKCGKLKFVCVLGRWATVWL